MNVLDASKGFESGGHVHGASEADDSGGAVRELRGRAMRKLRASRSKGMRIGVVREFMVKHAKNDAAISDQIDARDQDGAARQARRRAGRVRRSAVSRRPVDPEHGLHVPGRVRARFSRTTCPSTSGRRTRSGDARVRGAGLGRDHRGLRGRARAGQGAVVAEDQPAAHQQRHRQLQEPVHREQVPRASGATQRITDWARSSRTRSGWTRTSAWRPRTRSACRTAA